MPGRYSLEIPAGSKLTVTFKWYTDKPNDTTKNLSGWSAELVVRSRHGADGDSVVTLSTAAGSITLPGDGQVACTFAASSTSGISLPRGVWSLELTDPNDSDTPVRLLHGPCSIGPEV